MTRSLPNYKVWQCHKEAVWIDGPLISPVEMFLTEGGSSWDIWGQGRKSHNTCTVPPWSQNITILQGQVAVRHSDVSVTLVTLCWWARSLWVFKAIFLTPVGWPKMLAAAWGCLFVSCSSCLLVSSTENAASFPREAWKGDWQSKIYGSKLL